MENTLKSFIESFMKSGKYQEILEKYESEELAENIAKNNFFNNVEKITSAAAKNNAEKEKLDNIVLDYLGEVEETAFTLGFIFAFNVFQDVSKYLRR